MTATATAMVRRDHGREKKRVKNRADRPSMVSSHLPWSLREMVNGARVKMLCAAQEILPSIAPFHLTGDFLSASAHFASLTQA